MRHVVDGFFGIRGTACKCCAETAFRPDAAGHGFRKGRSLQIRVINRAGRIDEKDVAERRSLQISADIRLGLFMGRIIKAAWAFRLDQLFLFTEGIFLDEDSLQFRLRVTGILLYGCPAAAHGNNSHLQCFDLGDGVRLRLQLFKAFLKHVATEDENALHGLRRLFFENATAALITEKGQSPGGDCHQRQENHQHFGGYGMKTIQHGRSSPNAGSVPAPRMDGAIGRLIWRKYCAADHHVRSSPLLVLWGTMRYAV